jgi:hypothetical protein
LPKLILQGCALEVDSYETALHCGVQVDTVYIQVHVHIHHRKIVVGEGSKVMEETMISRNDAKMMLTCVLTGPHDYITTLPVKDLAHTYKVRAEEGVSFPQSFVPANKLCYSIYIYIHTYMHTERERERERNKERD